MEADNRGRGGGGGLIPGLPEEVVLAHVVPRLPWYTRPVCRTISKSWRAFIDTCRKRKELQLKSRKYQLPLLNGLFVICTFDTHIFITRDRVPHEEVARAEYNAFQWRNHTYQFHRQWRKLPPVQHLLPPSPTWATVIASSGMIYVWSNQEECSFVVKLDMGGGDWTWNKFPIPHHFNDKAVHFSGKIYVPRVSTADKEKEMVFVYDMMTEECKPVEAWNRDNFRVLPKKSSCAAGSLSQDEEELYSFVEHESISNPKLEILWYDACRDSWRSRAQIPIPECQWSELPDVQLLNADCFEPAPEMGMNTVWIDSESQLISWFNSSLHEEWVDIDYNVFLEGRCLEYLQFIRGSVYGLFIEEKEEQEDEGEENKDSEEEIRGGKQDPSLFKRTLMKGTIRVASNIVIWEEVLEVGCFQEKYYIQPAVVSPIDYYTRMA